MGCINSKSEQFGSHHSQQTFAQLYTLKDELGRGAFSVVRSAIDNNTQKTVAVKIINKKKISPDEEQSLRQEIAILQAVNHPHVVSLFDVFDEKHSINLVLERIDGGELFDRIVSKTYYNEKEARDLVYILLSTVKHLHSLDIVHKDLKPENLLLVNKEDDALIKLADFGFAAKIDPSKGKYTLTNPCGTPGYVAPEILNKMSHGKPVDMWSVGVICYILLGGYPPFHEENKKKLYEIIKAGKYEFHDEYWGNVSDEAKDLIRRCLTVDMDRRITADEALQHSWITRNVDELAARDLQSNLVALKRFNARRKLRAGIQAVVAANRFRNIIANFRADRESQDMIRASECVPATSTQTVNGFGANTATSKTIVTNPTADSAINPASEAKNAPIDTTIGELDKNKTTETNATAAPTTTEEVTVEIPSQNSAPKKSKKNKKNKK